MHVSIFACYNVKNDIISKVDSSLPYHDLLPDARFQVELIRVLSDKFIIGE